jgi:hypothetical protein
MHDDIDGGNAGCGALLAILIGWHETQTSEPTHGVMGTPKCRTALFEVVDPYVGVENMNKSTTTRRSAWLKETSLFQDYAESDQKRPLCKP